MLTAVTQELVHEWLQELPQAIPQASGNSPILIDSSLKAHKSEKKEKVEVIWPHDSAFIVNLRSMVNYEQLMQIQFVLGFKTF